MVPKKRLIPRKRVRVRKPVKLKFKIDKPVDKHIFFEIPTKTITITMYAIRWFLFLILIYIVISVGMMFFTQSFEFLKQIVTLSLGGFFGFFMGYFGWLLAQQITMWLSGKKKEKEFFENLRF